MNYYDILNIDSDATKEEIEVAIVRYEDELFKERSTGKISAEEFIQKRIKLREIEETLLDDSLRKEYDEFIAKSQKKKSGKKKGLIAAVATGAVAAAIAVSVLATPLRDNISNLFIRTGTTPTQQEVQVSLAEDTEETKEQNQETTGDQTQETTEQTQEPEVEYPEVKNYGDIMDDALVTERATALVEELKRMNIINPTTGTLYTVEEIHDLILYANGVYIPETLEEIDILHLNLLNLLISPLNTDPYLYHVVYATGNDDFKDLALEAVGSIKQIDFAQAFAEYGTNGVYPLTRWIQAKREAIYTAIDRESINSIYIEVGQVMADIMKGNGCTIKVIENGEQVTYTYTSEQILANHASAMLLTTEAQLIFANHYELRDVNDNIIDQVQSSWEVYNKFNGDEPDIVTLDEIQAWINNGCDYEWGIDSVLINGQTFGQRIQGDLEGMAQNNLAMNSGKTLTK